MAASKLICPECDTVLRPAKPLAAGKKVKCPRCGTTFPAPAEDLPAAPAKDKKPAAKKKEAKPPPEKKPGMQYETTTYAVIKDEEDKEQEATEDRGDDMVAMYLKQSKSKDPRGAQETVNRPSNWLFITGVCGVAGYAILLLGLIIIFWMPPKEPDDQAESGGKKRKLKGLELGPALSLVAQGADPFQKAKDEAAKKATSAAEAAVYGAIASIQEMHVLLFFLFSILLLIGIAYASLIIYGAVRAQSLEAMGWWRTSSILAMIPLHGIGFGIITLSLLYILAGILYDEGFFQKFLVIIFAAVEVVWGISIGTWNIRTQLDESVIAGFEYTDEESEGNVV